jgi:hypothetical protein
MSTRCTIKYERDEATGQEIHLYEDLLDDLCCVLLEVEGFTFETSVSVAPSGRLDTRVLLRIPKPWARKLGLIANDSKP